MKKMFLMVWALSIAAAFAVPITQRDCEVSDTTDNNRFDWIQYRGEGRQYRTRYFQNGDLLTSFTNLVNTNAFLSLKASNSTNTYSLTGSVYSATGGVVSVLWPSSVIVSQGVYEAFFVIPESGDANMASRGRITVREGNAAGTDTATPYYPQPVLKIIAGSGVLVDPASGVGDVTVSASGGEGSTNAADINANFASPTNYVPGGETISNHFPAIDVKLGGIDLNSVTGAQNTAGVILNSATGAQNTADIELLKANTNSIANVLDVNGGDAEGRAITNLTELQVLTNKIQQLEALVGSLIIKSNMNLDGNSLTNLLNLTASGTLDVKQIQSASGGITNLNNVWVAPLSVRYSNYIIWKNANGDFIQVRCDNGKGRFASSNNGGWYFDDSPIAVKDASVFVYDTDGNVDYLVLKIDNNKPTIDAQETDFLNFQTLSTNRMSLTSSGLVISNNLTAGGFTPNSSNTVDLGTQDIPFRQGFFGAQGLHMKGVGTVGYIFPSGGYFELGNLLGINPADSSDDLGSTSKRWGTVYSKTNNVEDIYASGSTFLFPNMKVGATQAAAGAAAGEAWADSDDDFTIKLGQ